MKTRGLKPQSRRHRLGHLDGRTYEAKFYTQFRADLIAHVGGEPTIPQIAIIERVAPSRATVLLAGEIVWRYLAVLPRAARSEAA